MKGIAFALDPDGYWIELVPRRPDSPHAHERFTLAQTMIRVKDPKRSLAFYSGLLGMTKIREAHHSDFSLYFLAHLRNPEQAEEAPKDPSSPDAAHFIDRLFQPVIELTHNHGTENDPEFSYHNGNDEDLQVVPVPNPAYTTTIISHIFHTGWQVARVRPCGILSG